MSRNVEVLCEMLAEQQENPESWGYVPSPAAAQREARRTALSAAMSALEEKDPACVCSDLNEHKLSQHVAGKCTVPNCACGPGCIHDGFVSRIGGAIDWQKMYATAKSSSDSMEERIRGLTQTLGVVSGMLKSLAETPRVRMASVDLSLPLDTIARALRPHQSWCRGDHSEGACSLQENSEP